MVLGQLLRYTCSFEWLRKHPDDIGLFTHELVHVVQAYPKSDPTWLTEGLADYARHSYGPKKQPGWALPSGWRENRATRTAMASRPDFCSGSKRASPAPRTS